MQSLLDSVDPAIALPSIAADIPAALPTNAEIEASKDVLIEFGGRRVVRVGKHFVVKYGLHVDIIEGENMLFVRRTTTILIPKVYGLYTEPNTRKDYTVMENIEGETLASKWPSLTESQKRGIVTKLKLYFDELRKLSSPGYFGSLGNRPLLDDILWTKEKSPSINGPFQNEDAINEAMAQKYTFETSGRSIIKQTSTARLCLEYFMDTRQYSPTPTFSAKTSWFEASLQKPACGMTVSVGIARFETFPLVTAFGLRSGLSKMNSR